MRRIGITLFIFHKQKMESKKNGIAEGWIFKKKAKETFLF